MNPSLGRAGEEQFFVPTLRVHVLRSWFRIEDIRARTRSRIRALRDDRGCRDKCPTTKNGTDVRSSSVPIFAYSGQRPARSGCLWVHTFEDLSVPLFCSSQSTSNAFARSYAQPPRATQHSLGVLGVSRVF